jgi:glycerophosphoryl diester phosphodiesterase
VLFHDHNLERLIGKDELIKDVEYEILKNEKIIFIGNESEESIMPLNDFLIRYNKGIHIYLDIKSSKKVMADQLLDIFEKLSSHDNVYVANSNLLFLSYLKYKNPKIKTILEGFNSGKEWIYYLIPKNYMPTFFASFLSAVDMKHMEWLKANNLNQRKVVYGIDSTNYLKAAELGIQNVILDYNNNMGQVVEIKNLLN